MHKYTKKIHKNPATPGVVNPSAVKPKKIHRVAANKAGVKLIRFPSRRFRGCAPGPSRRSAAHDRPQGRNRYSFRRGG